MLQYVSKSPRHWRERFPSFYAAFLQIPQLSEMQEIKFDVSIPYCLYLFLCHTQFFLELIVQNYNLFSKSQNKKK
jgi:hypothetical protein